MGESSELLPIILLRLQQDEFGRRRRHAAQPAYGSRSATSEYSAGSASERSCRKRSLEWVIFNRVLASCASRFGDACKQTRLDYFAEGRLLESKVGRVVRAAGGDGPHCN